MLSRSAERSEAGRKWTSRPNAASATSSQSACALAYSGANLQGELSGGGGGGGRFGAGQRGGRVAAPPLARGPAPPGPAAPPGLPSHPSPLVPKMVWYQASSLVPSAVGRGCHDPAQ